MSPPLHLEILDMATGGVPLDAIEQFVTGIEAATAICTTGLANGQPEIAATILRWILERLDQERSA